ncbi:MAG TPA: outer membrane protein assembly factor BamD [Candidatus Aminicenantes bacterium]|nr:outer membrane protein assembly factor BamD [Candidatus Aminicenantes bacterium]
MKKLSLALTISLLCLMISFGCGKKKTAEILPGVASSDEALFKIGEGFIKKDPEKARLYLRQVIDSFPKSFYAQKAKLAIADSYFRKRDQGSMILAASEYREFISLFPYSPSAPLAQHQIGMTFYRKILKPGRDQTKAKQALAEFKKVVTNYPSSEEAKSAQEKILDCEDRLAAHNLHIGAHYYRIKAYKAAISRLAEILTTFPNFSKMDSVYYYLGDSYYKATLVEQSIPYFTKLITDFPQSKLAKKATARLEEAENKKK